MYEVLTFQLKVGNMYMKDTYFTCHIKIGMVSIHLWPLHALTVVISKTKKYYRHNDKEVLALPFDDNSTNIFSLQQI
jgi:nitrate reductase gamma subunit